MGRRSDVSVPELEVAGNGLLDRRIFLKQGVALLSAGGLVATLGGAARAAESPGAPSPGAGMSDYGHPAPFESKVKRTLIRSQAGTTGSGASRTPLEMLEGTLTPSGLHFERHHSGVPDIDPATHRVLIHGMVKRPLTFTVDALSRYPMVSRVHFLECSGNSASMMAVKAKTGEYVWHFQQVHHDIWDYDAASPVVLFDTVIDGKPRKGIAEAGRTGWLYILDRTDGKPLIGIPERPVPQEPRQKTAKTQPYPIGDATVPQCAELVPGFEKAGCIFEPFWETPVVMRPSGLGGTNWSPVPYSPDTGYFYVPGTVRTSAFGRYSDKFLHGQRYVGGTQAAPIGTVMSGTFTAMDAKTNKIVWQHKTPYRLGGGGGSSVTAGGLVFRGEPDGNFLALNAKTGEELWRFQTGFGADAPPVIYEVDGEQFVAIATGGNQLQGSAYGDAVWVFSLKGQLGPLWPPPPPSTVAGPTGPIATGVDTVKMGSINVEYSFVPSRVRIKAGTSLTFTNVGDLPHNAVAWEKREWDTGILASGGTAKVTFDTPGVYYYICTPHPWMYGQVIVE